MQFCFGYGHEVVLLLSKVCATSCLVYMVVHVCTSILFSRLHSFMKIWYRGMTCGDKMYLTSLVWSWLKFFSSFFGEM